MMSQAVANVASIEPSGGASNVSAVSATASIRSSLNVRIAPRVSSQPMRYRARVAIDGSMRYGRTRAVRHLDHPSLGPGAGQPLVDRALAWRLGSATRHKVECLLDVRRQHLRQAGRQLLERRREIGVVVVRVASHQPRRQEDRHRLGLGQVERREEALLVDPVPAVRLPDRQLQLVLDRDQVPIGGPLGHPDRTRNLGRRRAALATALEERHHPVEACGAIPLGAQAVAFVVDHRVSREA